MPDLLAAPAAQGEKEERADKLRGGALDPRRPEAIVGAAKPSEHEIRSRIDELQGEKSALDRKQVERNGQRSAVVKSTLRFGGVSLGNNTSPNNSDLDCKT